MLSIIKKISAFLVSMILIVSIIPAGAYAEGEKPQNSVFKATAEKPFRREVSPDSPMWLVHIDTWNSPDPFKIIDLIPEEIRPFVVFNISLSISWDEENQKFQVVEYGYETAKSWLRACSEAGVWAMVQPASGGPCHLPDLDPLFDDFEDSVFGEFFRDYPSFIGFNYCEQFWGFDNYVKGFPVTAEQRYKHFAGLLELCNKYGGYLVDSWCGNEWGQSINPLAMIKRIPEFEEAARLYSDNFILLEKYTQTGYLSDMESLVLGTYLSGYCGNFGIRYDDTGWTSEDGVGTGGYTTATGLPLYFERMLLNGATVIDGPELVPNDDFYEDQSITDNKGYTSRQWNTYTQFKNVVMDFFKKLTDGGWRIPTREEVIKRTKFILVNDIETGKDDDKYCTPLDMYEGLYKADGDGNLKDNHSHYKKTGRFPTVPTTAGFADDTLKNLFETVLPKSEYKTRWATVDDKVFEFEDMFPEEYSGVLYAGRYLNTWVIYNPYKRSQNATAEIPFKYNTAEKMTVDFPRYSSGVVREYPDRLEIYLSNYNEDDQLNLKTDVITVSGCSSEPEISYTDRGVDNIKPAVETSFSGGTYTITINHNGPIDLTVKCSGSASGRDSEIKEASLKEPEPPEIYYGIMQHEAEVFDVSEVEQVVANGAGGSIRDYRGQGYTVLGMDGGAKLRDQFTANASGKYALTLRYRSGNADLQVLVNGRKYSAELADTNKEWAEITLECALKKGDNTVEVRMPGASDSKVYLDNIKLELTEAGSSGIPAAAVIAIISAAVTVVVVIVLVMVLKKKK